MTDKKREYFLMLDEAMKHLNIEELTELLAFANALKTDKELNDHYLPLREMMTFFTDTQGMAHQLSKSKRGGHR